MTFAKSLEAVLLVLPWPLRAVDGGSHSRVLARAVRFHPAVGSQSTLCRGLGTVSPAVDITRQ